MVPSQEDRTVAIKNRIKIFKAKWLLEFMGPESYGIQCECHCEAAL
jgi:hypothetical protein